MSRLLEAAPVGQQAVFVQMVEKGHEQLVDEGLLDDIALPFLRARYPRAVHRWDEGKNNDQVRLGAGYFEQMIYGPDGPTQLYQPVRLVVVHYNIGSTRNTNPYHMNSLNLEGKLTSRITGFEKAISNPQARVLVDLAEKAADQGFGYLSVQSALTRIRTSPPTRT